jgi:hypothetical protein
MPVINPTLPTDDTTADVADYNVPILAILALLNGGLDSDNFASLPGTKVTNNTLELSAFTQAARMGWYTGILPAPNTITYNGNRSYSLVFNTTDLTGDIQEGMRIRTTRTIQAPTQCTSLNGTTQYWVKTSPNKSTFTDDFVVTAYVKATSYVAGHIISRWNGTSGWVFRMNADGTLELFGTNGGVGNFSTVKSYQSLPLNRWVRVTAQLDMSSFTASSTTSYVMIDDVDVPVAVSRGGTNPTSLVQAGNLEVGSANGGASPFAGKIAQAAYFVNKVTQSTIAGYSSQGFSGSETNLGSAYSFNGVATDLNTTTPNDLAVGGGSATATNADSPFGNAGASSTKDYGIVMSRSFSTNTTLVVQVPEGCAIPTSGGVSAVDYSGLRTPYGFPADENAWVLLTMFQDQKSGGGTANTWVNLGHNLSIPIGKWFGEYSTSAFVTHAGATFLGVYTTLSSSPTAESEPKLTSKLPVSSVNLTVNGSVVEKSGYIINTNLTPYYLNIAPTHSSTTVLLSDSTSPRPLNFIRARNAYL